MDKEQSLRLIEKLSNANGVSGFEDEVAGIFSDAVRPFGKVVEDHMRNVYVKRNENSGNGLVVQLDAHSDEVGFMVQAIKPNGMLRFVTVGGWVRANIPAHKVRVRNREGVYIPAIIASTPPHFMTPEERNRLPQVADMVIDVGATSAEEAAHDFKIDIGAPVVPDVTFEFLREKDVMLGKAFDNRIGTAVMAEVLRELDGTSLNVDVVASLSAQEEVGERGAQVAVKKVSPDVSVVFEGAPADDTVMPDYMIQTGLKRGPMLRDFDKSIIVNPRFQKFCLDIAKKNEIKVQRSVRTGGGNDGAVINLYQGAPTVVISVPVRYAHTPYCFVAYEDFVSAVNLTVEILKSLDTVVIGGF
ncbi:M20/M25/M40 family metallo-hydrolase [Sporolactobacillus sp. STSJ-5]|uniref:M42 family metallopeptidase n=1 Tax=Sporolactobacillus sp. STSJ-5 TaxID=2965076 RepID=UPI0021060184|nr:M20/M25/M40 family metallo-hydrolase [Sporolactobacillus sp. STSJ-5]MCQ2010429.1 M20/M25/M40 family metallo-hydrolase [Sporolactobacillus sp. STSJ-5]